MRTALNRGRR